MSQADVIVNRLAPPRQGAARPKAPLMTRAQCHKIGSTAIFNTAALACLIGGLSIGALVYLTVPAFTGGAHMPVQAALLFGGAIGVIGMAFAAVVFFVLKGAR